MQIPADKTMTTAEAAEKWNTTRSEVAFWCKISRIDNANKTYRWAIPVDAKRPVDKKLAREMVWSLVEVHCGVTDHFDLTEWGIARADLTRYVDALIKENYFDIDQSTYTLIATKKGLALIGRGDNKNAGSFDVIKIGSKAVVDFAVQTALQMLLTGSAA